MDVFVREPDGERQVLDVPDGVDHSGGFESWRTTVWGSEFVRVLGARFLPVPAERDPEVTAVEVPEFLREVAVPRARLDGTAQGTGRPRTVEEHRDDIDTGRVCGSSRTAPARPWGPAVASSSGERCS